MSNDQTRLTYVNVGMIDFVIGLMEEVFDRFDVFAGTSDVVP